MINKGGLGMLGEQTIDDRTRAVRTALDQLPVEELLTVLNMYGLTDGDGLCIIVMDDLDDLLDGCTPCEVLREIADGQDIGGGEFDLRAPYVTIGDGGELVSVSADQLDHLARVLANELARWALAHGDDPALPRSLRRACRAAGTSR